MREYVVYSDESEQRGRYYSDFFGGILVRSEDRDRIVRRIVRRMEKNGFGVENELKWSKTTPVNLAGAKNVMDLVFDLVERDKLKVRIMFSHNVNVAEGLTPEQKAGRYNRLYYQFFKWAWGMQYANDSGEPIRLRLYLDRLPGRPDEKKTFKEFLAGLSSQSPFADAKIIVPPDQIAEVDSRDHALLQCLDVILGSMQFRLNDKHLEKPPGQFRYGKKTKAKLALYKHIRTRICGMRPHFNIGESTGTESEDDLWGQPYRHWRFVPKNRRIDPAMVKPKGPARLQAVRKKRPR